MGQSPYYTRVNKGSGGKNKRQRGHWTLIQAAIGGNWNYRPGNPGQSNPLDSSLVMGLPPV